MKKVSILLFIFLVLTVSSVYAKGANEKNRKICRLGIALRNGDSPSEKSFAKHIKNYLDIKSSASVGYKVTVVDAENDVSVQNSQIEKLIDESDAIICFPVGFENCGSVAGKTSEAGLPCVIVGNSLSSEDYGDFPNVCFIETDCSKGGEFMAEVIDRVQNDCDANGDDVISYLLIRGEGPESELRGKAAVAFLESNGKKTECVFEGFAKWQKENAHDICLDVLQKSGNRIDLVICDSDDMASGASDAIEECKRKVGKNIYLVGFGADDEALSSIKAGKMTGTVLVDIAGQAETACDTVISMLKGDEVEKKIVFECQNVSFM